MKYRQKDTERDAFSQLKAPKTLPRPLYGQALTLPNTAIGRRHSHPWGQLSYATQGVIEVSTAAGRFVAPPHRAVWIPAGVPHGVKCYKGTVIRSLYIDSNLMPVSSGGCRVVVVSPLLRELIRAFSAAPIAYDEDGPD